MITISGVVSERNTTTTTPKSGVVVTAYKASDDSVVAMATSDAAGMYSISVTTNGVALDGYLKATNTGDLDTYLYPPGAGRDGLLGGVGEPDHVQHVRPRRQYVVRG